MVAGSTSERVPTDVVGKVEAMTVLNPVRRFWPAHLAIVFWVMRHIPWFTEPLRQLSFIHFARWTLMKRIPYNGPPQKREKLSYQYLFFTSHFNGSWDQYVDAFSWTMARHVQQVWGSSWGFPGALPVEPFLAYTRQNQYMPSHLASAYPDVTHTSILHALELERRFRAFHASTTRLEPLEFKAAYDEFLRDVQSYLT